MKKKILVMICIVCACFIGVYAWFNISRANVLKDFLSSASNNIENVGIIHDEGLIRYLSDEEISKLDGVVNGDLPAEAVKEDRDGFVSVATGIIDKISKSSFTPKKNVDQGEIIKFGVVHGEDYLYIFENGAAVLKNGDKYYAYIAENLDSILELYNDLTSSIQGDYFDPYYNFNR